MSKRNSQSEDPRPGRTPIRLNLSLDKGLMTYAVAASAAGVGMLALAQPANAKIIYTPAHRNIGAKTLLDLNHDGIADFKLSLIRTSHCVGGCTTTGMHHGTAFASSNVKLSVYGAAAKNQIFGGVQSASALPAGVRVGPHGKFPGGNVMAEANAINGTNQYYKGGWAGALGGGGVLHHYLGLKFVIKGKIHFGWARLNVVMSHGATVQATLTGFAYETVPNTPITTGKTKGLRAGAAPPDSAFLARPVAQPTTLGMLATGTPALSIWRKQPDPSLSALKI